MCWVLCLISSVLSLHYCNAAMKPFSLDMFEDQLYWVAKEKGEVWRQNKFGKGNKEKVLVVNPWLTQVRIFHQLRYNQSGNPVLGREVPHGPDLPYLGTLAIVLVEGSRWGSGTGWNGGSLLTYHAGLLCPIRGCAKFSVIMRSADSGKCESSSPVLCYSAHRAQMTSDVAWLQCRCLDFT